jgi:hypothetical protein
MSMGSTIGLAAIAIAFGLFGAVVTWLGRESARDRRKQMLANVSPPIVPDQHDQRGDRDGDGADGVPSNRTQIMAVKREAEKIGASDERDEYRKQG